MSTMNFEWNEEKSDRCLRDRGFDFAYVLPCFYGPYRLVQIDNRRDYGEVRYQMIAQAHRRLFFTVYTVRISLTRIISARKANLREIRSYEKNLNKN